MSYQQDAYQPVAFQSGAELNEFVNEITGVFSYFAPDMAFIFEDAFERAGISPQSIDTEKMYSALRSTHFILNSEWLNYGIRQWMVKQHTETVDAGDNVFDMPAGSVAMLNILSRRQSADVVLTAMSRQEYSELPSKTTPGRPNRFFVDKQYNQLQVYLWPVPEIDETLIFDYLRTAADPGVPTNTLEMAPAAVDCFTEGLAMRLAQKFNYKRYNDLRTSYGGPGYPSQIRGKLFYMRAGTGEDADLQLNFKRRR
jgi:hypothetical protein